MSKLQKALFVFLVAIILGSFITMPIVEKFANKTNKKKIDKSLLKLSPPKSTKK